MERSTDSLVYKGSIPDAINEARRQNKLFVVYISGEDENSKLLEQSTLVDQYVMEVVSKCCIFLHLLESSVDASQFSSIYPQNSVPSISVVGLNGVMLWHHEGYITAENLKESMDKAWVALHLQATLMTAALASKVPEPPVGPTSDAFPPIQPATASSAATSSLPDGSIESSQSGPVLPNLDQSVDQRLSKPEETNEINEIKESESPTYLNEREKSDSEDLAIAKQKIKLDKNTPKDGEIESIDLPVDSPPPDSTVIKSSSNEVHLNIRLPSGPSLQMKLTKSDALRSVKNFVDENQSVGQLGPYDLAVPYPRKLFTEQDMDRTLSELGFTGRDALIVVPHQRVRGSVTGQSSSASNSNVNADLSSDDSTGYFQYLKRFVSYMNPFSYFGGNNSSSPGPATSASDSSYQYRPNPAFQANDNSVNIRGASTTTNSNNSNNNNNNNRSLGSNIHTLRHRDDQIPPRDRNVFWNGNSTEFGGDDNDRN